MFEFPFIAPWAFHFQGVQRSRYTGRRLKKLAGIAATLHKAGWPTWLTVTGLAFVPVGVEGEDYCKDCFVMKTAERLADIGVEEAFLPFFGKTLQELRDEEEEEEMSTIGPAGKDGIVGPSNN